MDRGFGRVVLFFVYLVPEMSPDSFKKHFRVIYFLEAEPIRALREIIFCTRDPAFSALHQMPRLRDQEWKSLCVQS